MARALTCHRYAVTDTTAVEYSCTDSRRSTLHPVHPLIVDEDIEVEKHFLGRGDFEFFAGGGADFRPLDSGLTLSRPARPFGLILSKVMLILPHDCQGFCQRPNGHPRGGS
jgi:hypothetical protein